jgi:CheY-like chemotaxis protein
MAKTALIVDDSASARFVLGGMLAEQSLAVDTAASGEEALEYLRHARPDVIFMDHMMPGMDGFQALEAIKENPATATIPVMMYTSQEGELYVGQARALGAIGVLPKQVHPVEVTKVLNALHLTAESESNSDSDSDSDSVQETPAVDSDESVQVNAMLEELFREQRAILRDDIRRGYEHIAETTATTRVLDVREPSNEMQSGLLSIGLAILAVACIGFAYLYYDAQELLTTANDRIAQLADDLRGEEAPAGDATATQNPPAAIEVELLEFLEWGVSHAERYRFSETALNDERAALVEELVRRLRVLGFAGAIALDVHVGHFCMNSGPDGAMILPPATQLFEECQQLGWSEAESLSLGALQTLQFANALALESREGDIRFEIVSHGASQPRSAYPSFTQGLTAGEWNEIAASNQRVEIRILPEQRPAGL